MSYHKFLFVCGGVSFCVCVSEWVCNRQCRLWVWGFFVHLCVCAISIILCFNSSYFFKQELDWCLTSLSYLIYSAHSTGITGTTRPHFAFYVSAVSEDKSADSHWKHSYSLNHHSTTLLVFKNQLRYIFWKIGRYLYIYMHLSLFYYLYRHFLFLPHNFKPINAIIFYF